MQKSREELQMPLKLLVLYDMLFLKIFTCLLRLSGLCIGPVSCQYYGSEFWTPLRGQLRKLNSFHHGCVRSVLGITNQQQWEQRISSGAVRAMWG